MKICHECRVKLGHKRKDKGAHTAILCKCDECGRIKSILPARHWVEGKQMTKSVFETLSQIDVKSMVINKGGTGMSYIPWSVCVREVSKVYPDFTWEFTQFEGLPFLATVTGFYVECSVTINGITRKQMRPVMDFKNKAMMEPTAMDIDKAQQRALAKAIALHGFGLELWAGEDFETVELKIEAQEDKAVQEIEVYAKWKKEAVLEYQQLDSPKAVQTRCTAHIRRATKMNDKAFIKELSDIRDNRIKELTNA